ncbi:hypothetical protein AYO47_01225 [Planctomyces sp. SCGC AG-212-M04]|nr:hypothetical protein AYO47_01225 [Planctomyces sp. SCGC AG-212-M04]
MFKTRQYEAAIPFRTRAGILTVIAVLAIAPRLVSSADNPATSQAAASALDQCEIYPLGVNTVWIYRSGPLEVREKVAKHEEIQGQLCARIETFYDDRVVSFEHLTVRSDGVYRVATGGKPIEPPLKIISLPAKPGVKWTVASSIAGQAVRGEFVSSEGTFHLRSPRGDQDQTLKTYRVTGEHFQAGGESVTFTCDFVPQYGKVRQTAKAHGLETTLELRDISTPQQTPTRTAAGGTLYIR